MIIEMGQVGLDQAILTLQVIETAYASAASGSIASVPTGFGTAYAG